MTRRRVVIGIGNTLRRDDGVGPSVITSLAALDLPGTQLVVSDGEPTTLLEAWHGAEVAIVVDAVRPGLATPGTIHRIDLVPGDDQVLARRTAGSHDFAVTETLRLAAALDRCPQRLVVYAVEVADVGFGSGLSADVLRAVPELRRLIVAELADASVTSAVPS
jgi:hydrogenase maturation protease